MLAERSRLTQFRNAESKVKAIAASKGLTPEQFAINLATENRPQIEGYLLRNGVTPSSNDAELCAQVFKTRCEEIQHFAQFNGLSHDLTQAEAALLRAEDELNAASETPELFDASLLGSLFDTGGNILDGLFNPSGETVHSLYLKIKANNPASNNATVLQSTINSFQAARNSYASQTTGGTAASRDLAKKYIQAYDALIKEYGAYLATVRAGGQLTVVDTVKAGALSGFGLNDALKILGGVVGLVLDKDKPLGDQIGTQLQTQITTGALGSDVKAAYEAIVREQKKQELQKMLPWIIGGAVLLIVVVYLIAKRSK